MKTQFSPFEESLWHATAIKAPITSSLEEVIKTDICIVGGGYAGMSTALELAKDGISVILLEAKEPGFGGSGRNAGHCTPTFHYYSLTALRKVLGIERAKNLIQRQTSGANIAAEYIQKYQIDCEWRQNGYFEGALIKSRLSLLQKKAESYAEVGCPSILITSEQAKKLTGSDRFFGGWLLKSGGHLNPLSYARGMARAVLQEGGLIFTESKVDEVEQINNGWAVKTSKGKVIADKVIMCTGAYTDGGWKDLDKTFNIQKVFVAATNPMPKDVRRKVLPFDGTMHDGRGDICVYKYDGEGRLVVSMFPVGKRGRDLPYTKKMLLDRLRWLHAAIPEGTQWDYFWFGELDMQRHTIPRLYHLAPGVIGCTGLSGRGVPTGTMLGGILSDWVRGVRDQELALPLEKLSTVPAYMKIAPSLMLRWYGIRDHIAARLEGTELPPHA